MPSYCIQSSSHTSLLGFKIPYMIGTQAATFSLIYLGASTVCWTLLQLSHGRLFSVNQIPHPGPHQKSLPWKILCHFSFCLTFKNSLYYILECSIFCFSVYFRFLQPRQTYILGCKFNENKKMSDLFTPLTGIKQVICIFLE